MHMLRADDPHFRAFGEIYFSGVQHGKEKGWYRHREKTLNFAVPVGTVRVVIYDDRAGSPTLGRIDEHLLGEAAADYALLTIPPLLWYGMQGVGPGISLIANCTNLQRRRPSRAQALQTQPMCPTRGRQFLSDIWSLRCARRRGRPAAMGGEWSCNTGGVEQDLTFSLLPSRGSSFASRGGDDLSVP